MSTYFVNWATYLARDVGGLRVDEALRGLVPVSAHALARQLNFVLVFLHDLAQTEVSDFNFAIVENDVLGLQIVMDDSLALVVEVLEPTQDLTDDQLSFLLWDVFVFL